MGPVLHVVVGVDDAGDQVARLEVLELVGPGADRLEVGRRLARLGADIVGEQVLGHDAAGGSDEGVGPERRRLLEFHDDAVLIDLLDRDVPVGPAGERGRRRIAGVFPGEDDVVGGQGLAVVPPHTLLQLPGHRLAVGGERAVLAARDRLRQHGLEVAVAIPARKRLIEQTRAVLVLGADGEVRIEQGRALPPQHLQEPATAALGRLVGRSRLRHGHARQGEKLGRHRRRQPHDRHTLHEGTPGHPARLHLVQKTTQVAFVHRMPPMPSGKLKTLLPSCTLPLHGAREGQCDSKSSAALRPPGTSSPDPRCWCPSRSARR